MMGEGPGSGGGNGRGWAAGGAPAASIASLGVVRGDERWRHFDNSVSAVSFGFVATAILIFMFLVMAVFERFLHPQSFSSSAAAGRRDAGAADLEALHHPRGGIFAGKLDYPSPKMSVYAKGVSVLMPGQAVPTFIAHPAPAPCPPEGILWPTHEALCINRSPSNTPD